MILKAGTWRRIRKEQDHDHLDIRIGEVSGHGASDSTVKHRGRLAQFLVVGLVVEIVHVFLTHVLDSRLLVEGPGFCFCFLEHVLEKSWLETSEVFIQSLQDPRIVVSAQLPTEEG